MRLDEMGKERELTFSQPLLYARHSASSPQPTLKLLCNLLGVTCDVGITSPILSLINQKV